jgi:hypothetical protein
MRATTSVGPPAANGTMSFTGRDGNSAVVCAEAAPAAIPRNSRTAAMTFIGLIACGPRGNSNSGDRKGNAAKRR